MKIDYVELPADDLDKARKFYTKVCGWKFTSWSEDYISFENSGIMGGFQRTQNKNIDGHKPLLVLYSDSIEEAKHKIEAAGGIIKNFFDFPGGKRFHFEDPVGNELAVWTKNLNE